MAYGELTAIVAEDHAFQRGVAVDYLLQQGVGEVLEAADGNSAIRLLSGRSRKADILFCDLDMPGMDGVELIRHVATGKLVNALVLLSGLDTILIDSVDSMARAHGINILGSIEKPVTPQKLANVLARFPTLANSGPAGAARRPFSAEAVAQALHAGLIRPHFQPKVSFATREVLGVETLARWHADDVVHAPNLFIPVAEQSELIDELTWSMLRQALAERKHWPFAGEGFRTAINISVATLGRLGTADKIVDIAQQCGVSAKDIILEVTESLVTSNLAHVLENLARLRMRGFGISIDDYGTGFSSMQQLSRIPFTELKIDQSFVSGATTKPNVRAILESSLQLARKLGLVSVAEGIEREEEWSLLKSMGCDIAQGYFIAHPMPASAFAAWHEGWVKQLA
jgi:EAL domain-containing protein (putative c-di-GMP-specific phosphodiesterase class I)/FixJ family two-component response regulator